MNLELKHIAPYLPYELQMIGKYGQTETLNLSNTKHALQYWKPILRPLSDFTEFEIEFDNITTTIEDYITGNWDLGSENWILAEVAKGKQIERLFDLPYSIFPILFEHHFDIFGLIEEGLAVDINSLVEFKI